MSVAPRRVRILVAALVSILAVVAVILLAVLVSLASYRWARFLVTVMVLVLGAAARTWVFNAPDGPRRWLESRARGARARPSKPVPRDSNDAGPSQHTSFAGPDAPAPPRRW